MTVLRYLTGKIAGLRVPKGTVVVHNQVRPSRELGLRGSRVWLAESDDSTIEPCDCGWAPELGTHYRVTSLPTPKRQRTKK